MNEPPSFAHGQSHLSSQPETTHEREKIAIRTDQHQTSPGFTLEQAMCLLDTDQVMDRALFNVMQDLQPVLQAIDQQKSKLD